jgi:hypothetical protein
MSPTLIPVLVLGLALPSELEDLWFYLKTSTASFAGVQASPLHSLPFLIVRKREVLPLFKPPAVSNLNRNRWEGFSRRKPQPESESRGTRGGDR